MSDNGTPDNYLGTCLYYIIWLKGLEFIDVAKATGVSRQMVSYIANNERRPSEKTVRKIAGYLNLVPQRLMQLPLAPGLERKYKKRKGGKRAQTARAS